MIFFARLDYSHFYLFNCKQLLPVSVHGDQYLGDRSRPPGVSCIISISYFVKITVVMLLVLMMMVTIMLMREGGMRPSSELLVIESGRFQIILSRH